MTMKVDALVLVSAVATAISLGAVGTTMAQTKGAQGYKCWGISKAGLNDCANVFKTHDCAGQSKTDYDLGDWRAVKDSSECSKLGGQSDPGHGMNPSAKKS